MTLVAQSASKLYDGLPLTRPSNALVYGLPAGFSINVTVSGSRTDAGSTVNTVSSWEIRNPVGEVVTSHFTNVETIPGSLVVVRAPLFVWTGSAEKVYDGTPLTMPDAEIHTVDGYTAGDPDWLNTSLVTETALGSGRMYGLSGHTYVQGTNPLTGESNSFDLPVGYSLTVLLHSGGEEDSIEFNIEKVAETDLPEEVLRLYADNPDMLAQAGNKGTVLFVSIHET